MGFDQVVGHARPLRVLRRALSAGRTHHAYLFWGPDGVGKERVADEVARALLCSDAGALAAAQGCGHCPSCAKLERGDHPDLHRVVAEGATIPIAAVRSLQEALSYQAFERGSKVAIIRDAFRMTREAANALLKTLEEPPAGTHIFLLARHRNQLLSTLVSRCQALRFDPLAEGEVTRVLVTAGLEASVAAELAGVAGGCPGQVRAEEPDQVQALQAEVDDAWARWAERDVGECFALAERWAKERDRLDVRLDALERRLSSALREAARHCRVAPAAVRALAGLCQVRRLLERNVNPQLALDALFLGVAMPGEEDTP